MQKAWQCRPYRMSWRYFNKMMGWCIICCACYYIFTASNTIHNLTPRMNYKAETDEDHRVLLTKSNLFPIENNGGARNLYSKGQYWKKNNVGVENLTVNEKFVILDCRGYSGLLEFLASPPKGWKVFVVNHKSESQLSSCQPWCESFTTSSNATSFLEQFRGKKIGDDMNPDSLLKMAAAFYAYSQGAPWVYVTNKLVPVQYHILDKVTNRRLTRGMVYRGPKPVFQPCSHFMDTFTWHGTAFLAEQSRYVLRSLPGNSLYQIVDNNCCYRQGMPDNYHELFDRQAPIPFVMPGVWAAVDFNNVLVPRKMFWTLAASMSEKAMASNLFPFQGHLSMIVQRLLWETQAVIAFVPGTASATGIQECPTCLSERTMEKIGPDHAAALTKWQCDLKRDLISCLHTVVSDALNNTGSAEDVKRLSRLLSAWTQYLEGFKIDTDKRTPLNEDILNARHNGNAIYFTPAKSLHNETDKVPSLPPNVFRDVCGNANMPYSAFIPDRHPKLFENTMLVISFNKDYFMHSINHLEFLFGRHFKHILYCATGIAKFENDYMKKSNVNPVSYIDVNTHRGYHGFLCAVAAMNMNYDVEGYLYMSDDVMINVWNMHHHPFDLPWFQRDMRVINLNNNFARGHDYGVDWYPWNKKTGRPVIAKSLKALRAAKNDPRNGTRVTWFLDNLARMASCDNCIAYMDADLFYIPTYMASDFQFFIPFFKDVFQELSIPTILAGITPRADLYIYGLRGTYLVGNYKRTNFDKGWSEEELFVHPVKLSQLVKSKKHNDFYCRVLGRMDKDLAKTHP